MVEKFRADGEDITDLFYWSPPSGRGGPIDAGSKFQLYPLADKAEWVIKRFRSLGTFQVEFYFAGGSSTAFLVRYVTADLTSTPRGGRDTNTITLLVVKVTTPRDKALNRR